MGIRTFFLPKDNVSKAEDVMHVCIDHIANLVRSNKKVRIRVDETVSKRSLEQNAVTHLWYAQMARELTEDDELGWKCYCKLQHGVPLLSAEDEDFRESIDLIGHHTYEQWLKIMRILPVTSLMNKSQLTKYVDAVRDDFERRGVRLEVWEPTR